MDKKPLIVVSLCAVVLLVIGSLSNVVGYRAACDTHILDPGWIRGPIWGRIDGYEFSGIDNETLFFYAKNVYYFGIGHAFNSGFYPRHWRNQEIKAFYSHFEGIITDHVIFGKIYGLPNQ
jgi:hypothetical protein